MKIFISWSGDLSRKLAECLKRWLEDVRQGSEVWISTQSLDKGTLWMTDLTETLSGNLFGILCVTHENVKSEWLLFEAGALSKGLTKSRVAPLCIDLSPEELRPPLSYLNGLSLEKEEMWKLLQSINRVDTSPLPDTVLSRAFEQWWPPFEQQFKSILESAKSTPVVRLTERQILDDVSTGVATLMRQFAQLFENSAIGNATKSELQIRCDYLEQQLAIEKQLPPEPPEGADPFIKAKHTAMRTAAELRTVNPELRRKFREALRLDPS